MDSYCKWLKKREKIEKENIILMDRGGQEGKWNVMGGASSNKCLNTKKITASLSSQWFGS